MNPKTTSKSKLPKRAFTKPSIVAMVFFFIIVLVLVPHTLPLYTNAALLQFLVLIYLSPLVIPGFFCSYHTGLALAKIFYKKLNLNFYVAFFAVLVIQIICVALCVAIEIMLTGYPIKSCFEICQQIEITDSIIAYLIFTTVLFLPAYYAFCRYSSWYYHHQV